MVSGILETQATFPTGGITRLGPRVIEAAAPPTESADRVEISPTAARLAKYHSLPDVRTDLVAKLRAQIRAGTYDTPEKWDAAVENLLEDLNP